MQISNITLFDGEVDKITIAINRIREFEPPEGYYVAFSGGKDSCVVLNLVKQAGVKYDAHYNLTTVDPPELVYFIREHHAEVKIHKPKLTMWELIVKKKIPPLRHMRYCCSELKERGGKGRFVITGVRHAESTKRAKRQMVHSCYTDNKKRFLHPIIDWSERDVWQFIKGNNLSYCKLYDEGFKRLGCVMCPLQQTETMQKEALRWPKIAEAYRKACNKAFKKNLLDDPEKERTWKNGDDMYNWWITGKYPEKEADGQERFFFD